jgi:peroxiredoxin Q/BCP
MNQQDIFLILFILWGLPLGILRSRFRKMVYNTDSWTINVRPVFIREIKVLLGILPLATAKEKTLRNYYGIYLLVYTTLFLFIVVK